MPYLLVKSKTEEKIILESFKIVYMSVRVQIKAKHF